MNLLNQVLHPYNLTKARDREIRNKGAAGVDEMEVSELTEWLQVNQTELMASIRNGTYMPFKVLGVEIEKRSGRKRLLGIPTVIDRTIQQAIQQVLSPMYERDFRLTAMDSARTKVLIRAFRKNILLDELDKELTKRGLRFIRYADDCSIFLGSKRSARRVLKGVTKFIEGKLKLKVNTDKTSICRPISFHLLGYNFISTYKRGEQGKYRLRVSPKSFKLMKQKVKQITRKSRPLSFDQRIKELNNYLKGWLGYYRFANMQIKLKDLDIWVRNRLRYCIWSR